MGLRFVAPARQLGSQVWTADIPPQQLRVLGDARGSQQGPSVIFVREPKYDAATSMLTFEVDGAVPVNVGTAMHTVVVGDRHEPSQGGGAVVVEMPISAIPARVPPFSANGRFFCRTQLRLR